MGPTLSTVFVVRDAERVLAPALDSVAGLADEIVVLDTGSVDGTLALLRERDDVRVHEAPFEGFGPSKQRAMELCRGDWVLSVDADERVSPDLADVVRRELREGPSHDAYRIRRRNWIQGRAMRTMGLGDETQLRLFRRGSGRFSDRQVHEGVELEAGATVGTIEAPLEHHTLDSIDGYLRKMDHYTTLELREGRRPHSTLHLIVVWPSTFLRFYVARGGWRDGWPGLLWAGLTATGAFMRDMKAWIATLPAATRGRAD